METKTQKDILKELGLENFPMEERDFLLGQFGENIVSTITLKALNSLSAENQMELKNLLLEENSEERIINFITSHVDNFEELSTEATQEILARFKEL